MLLMLPDKAAIVRGLEGGLSGPAGVIAQYRICSQFCHRDVALLERVKKEANGRSSAVAVHSAPPLTLCSEGKTPTQQKFSLV